VLLVLAVAWMAVLAPGALPAAVIAVIGLVIVLVGAYRAYGRIAEEKDERRPRREPDEARFTIKAATPYTGIPSGVNSLIIPDVAVVNWSDTPIELSFTLLAADGSGPIDSMITSSQPVAAGSQVLPNPMRLDPRSSRNGRLIWIHGGGDMTQYATAGAALRVLEEPSGEVVDIQLPTAGFDHPAPTRS
jgi:hypothetical protein